MASVADSHEQTMAGKKVLVQAQVDRDLYGQFRDLCGSHKLTIAQVGEETAPPATNG